MKPRAPRPESGANPGGQSWLFGPNPPASLDVATQPKAVADSAAQVIAWGSAVSVELPVKRVEFDSEGGRGAARPVPVVGDRLAKPVAICGVQPQAAIVWVSVFLADWPFGFGQQSAGVGGCRSAIGQLRTQRPRKIERPEGRGNFHIHHRHRGGR